MLSICNSLIDAGLGPLFSMTWPGFAVFLWVWRRYEPTLGTLLLAIGLGSIALAEFWLGSLAYIGYIAAGTWNSDLVAVPLLVMIFLAGIFELALFYFPVYTS